MILRICPLVSKGYFLIDGPLKFLFQSWLMHCCLWQVINLIPFNPIGTLSHFRVSTENKVTRFQKILREVYHIRTTVRKEMGQDISGACGQLVVNLPDERSTIRDPVTDIEDLRIWSRYMRLDFWVLNHE